MEVKGVVEELRSAIILGLPLKPPLVKHIFVNRKEEVELILRDIWGIEKTGRGGARLILGGAGLGKTTLIEYIRGYVYENVKNALFSYVELRPLSDIQPKMFNLELYKKVLEEIEDRDGRRGKELLTHISEKLHNKFSGILDKASLKLGRVRPGVVRKFEKIGGHRSTLLALAAMVFDDLNPIAYDYVSASRNLEPDEARAIRERLGVRIPWGLREADLIASLTAIVRAAEAAGYRVTIIAIDELEVLAGWRRDWIARVLPKLTAYIEVSHSIPCYILVTCTPEFWRGDKSIEKIYPFLYQRLNLSSIVLKELPRRDAVMLVHKIYSLYKKSLGSSAVEGIDVKYIAERIVEKAGGHPRTIVQIAIQEIESRIIGV